ncbi:MAG: IclR family transcriptional regulator, partial [Hyphomicrobiaceae bacterium]
MKKDTIISNASRISARRAKRPPGPHRQKTNGKGRNEIAALERATRLMLALADAVRPTPLSEAADRTRLSKATAFRILSTLVDQGFVLQDEDTGSYRLGVAPLRLATAVLDGLPVCAAARQPMRSVTDTLNETTVLSVRDGDFRVNIDAVECSNAISLSKRLGEPRPLYAGAVSRVHLAGMSDAELEAYLKRTKLPGTGSQTAAADRLRAEVQRIRRTGFASSLAEISPDSYAVATAIRDTEGRIV